MRLEGVLSLTESRAEHGSDFHHAFDEAVDEAELFLSCPDALEQEVASAR